VGSLTTLSCSGRNGVAQCYYKNNANQEIILQWNLNFISYVESAKWEDYSYVSDDEEELIISKTASKKKKGKEKKVKENLENGNSKNEPPKTSILIHNIMCFETRKECDFTWK
jgi:hypothetical protein